MDAPAAPAAAEQAPRPPSCAEPTHGVGGEVDGMPYFPGTFGTYPYLFKNYQQLRFLANGDVLMHETRGVGRGLLLSKKRADEILGADFVANLKKAHAALTAQRAAGSAAASEATRDSYLESEQEERAAYKALTASEGAKGRVKQRLQGQEAEIEKRRLGGRFPCIQVREDGLCYCDRVFKTERGLAQHMDPAVRSADEHRWPWWADPSADDRVVLMVHGGDKAAGRLSKKRGGGIAPSREVIGNDDFERTIDLCSYFCTTMSDDSSQDKYHLLIHRLEARYLLTIVDVEGLKEPQLMIYKSDGASVYNCAFSRFALRLLHLVDGGPRVTESLISVAGDGKTGLDRFFAEIGAKVRRYLDTCHDATDAAGFSAAVKDGGLMKAHVTSALSGLLREFEESMKVDSADLNRGRAKKSKA